MSRDWINPEYLREASVVFVWFTAVMPWSVIYAPLSGAKDVSAVFIRFPLFEVRYILGAGLPDQFYTPLSGYQLHAGEAIATGYLVWGGAALIWLIVFLFATALFARERRVAAMSPWPVPRVIGGLLVGAGIVFGVATVALLLQGFSGVPLPLGVIFMVVFGGVLVTNTR